MKLSTLFAKLTSSIKAMTLAGGLALAGAALTVAAPAASAQQFGIGVQFGGPRYVAPVPPPVYRPYVRGYVAPAYVAPAYVAPAYVAPGYWEHRQAEDWRAHEAWAHRDFDRHHGW